MKVTKQEAYTLELTNKELNLLRDILNTVQTPTYSTEEYKFAYELSKLLWSSASHPACTNSKPYTPTSNPL